MSDVTHPSKQDQQIANQSFDQLIESLDKVTSDHPEIEIEETGEKIQVPKVALRLLAEILGQMKKGRPFSLVPVAAEVTTQVAAEILNCSRPHVVKLLESGEIPFVQVGRHRRIKHSDVMEYREKMKANTKEKLIQMMKDAEGLDLYDS